MGCAGAHLIGALLCPREESGCVERGWTIELAIGPASDFETRAALLASVGDPCVDHEFRRIDARLHTWLTIAIC